MKICKNCASQFEDSAKFCNNCGEKLEESVQVKETSPVAEVEEIEEEGTVILEEESAAQEVAAEESADVPDEAYIEESTAGEFVPVEEIIETPAQEPAPEPVVEEVLEQVQEPEEAEVIQLVPETVDESSASIAAVSEKAEKKVEKLRQKAAKKAEKLAEKAEKKAKTEQGEKTCEKKKSKITFLGVLAAFLLSLFLIVNLGIVFVSSLGAGICASDIRMAELDLDGQIYSIDGLLDSVSLFDDENIQSLLEAIVYSDTAAEIVVDGYSYSVEFAVETVDMIEDVLTENENIEGNILEAINGTKQIVFYVFVSVLGFALIVAIICVIASVTSLGKRRKALLVPGTLLVLFGIVFLAATMMCSFAPSVFGLQLVSALFALEFVPLFAYASSGVVLLSGIVLFAVGITGKKA